MDNYARFLFSRRPEIEEIVVFGSFENDSYAPGSDIDVFLLLSESPKPIRDRIPDYLPRSFPTGVDLFPYTHEEISRLEPSPVLEAVRRSRWRYSRATHGR
ncbi:MAG TPA: nucleotidyltransferase domain-containing protein [Vicinamibacteria bacterium]|nr:nucleotidyltransferase domain-containing protein [Vicinamibacteria bacterium]